MGVLALKTAVTG